jgi:hypothetical protein
MQTGLHGDDMAIPDKQRLEQIHDLAANYSDRQGLRIVPMALVILSQCSPLVFRVHIRGIEVLPLLIVGGVLSYFLIGKTYERRFGRVEELPAQTVWLSGQLLLFLILLPCAVALDLLSNPPVFVSGLLLSAWIAVNAWPARILRKSYLTLCLLLALICLYPMTGMPRDQVAQLFGIMFGSFFLVAGVTDHLRLVKLLSAPEESDEQAAV